MTQLLNYLITATVYITVFYIFYLLLLGNDTQYRRNRIYLVSAIILSLLLPLIKIPVTGITAIGNLNRNISGLILIGQVDVVASAEGAVTLSFQKILAMVYFSGLIFSFAILLFNVVRIGKMIAAGREKGTRIVYTDSATASGFSAFGFIFLSRDLPAEEATCIRDHEIKHIEYLHFADLILLKVVSMLLWFNPLMHMFERSLKALHEYQADGKMLTCCENPVSYQQTIMNHLFSTSIFSINNAFSGSSIIKKRMIMMTKKRSGKFAGLKLFLIVPLILLFFVGFSCTSENDEFPVPAEETTEKLKTGSLTTETPVAELKEVSEKKEVFVVVEEMPAFQGGDINKFREWVQMNVKYPPIAKENGIQGKVFVMFVVNEDGSVSEAEITRGVDPSLDNESLRVVNSSPPWVPGKQRGAIVRVRFSITVNYQLQ